MDRPVRSLAKAATWQIMGFVSMTAITYAITGSLTDGGLVALGGAIAGSASYMLHERVWARIRWGQQDSRPL